MEKKKENKQMYIISKPNNWACYNNSNPDMFLSINKELKSMGFEEVLENIIPAEYYNKLTLVILPSYESNLGSFHYFNIETHNELSKIEGYSSEHYGRCIRSGEGTAIHLNKDIIGVYFKNKNLVCLIYPIYRLNGESNNKFVAHLLKLLKEGLKKLKAKTVKINEEEILARNFMSKIDSRINVTTNYILENQNYIEDFSRTIVNKYREIDAQIVEKEALQKFKDNGLIHFTEEFKKMSKLEFVKKIRMHQGALVYESPYISIKYKNKVYHIGEFIITIKPDKIYIKNKQTILRPDTKDSSNKLFMHHPHISAMNKTIEYGTICWGNFVEKKSQLLASCKLKDLAILIHLWLGTYSSESPYNKIEGFKSKITKKREVKEPTEPVRETSELTRHTEGSGNHSLRFDEGELVEFSSDGD